MSETLWRGVVPSISAREGIDVTATVQRTGAGIEIAYSFDDPEQHDIEDPILDAETCAHIAHQLTLVQTARRACEALMESRERIHDVYCERVDGEGVIVTASDEECGRAETAHAQTLVEYARAMTALPHSLL